MVEQSVFRGTIDFMARLGIYDVILPFLLVFTIVFAILEKTAIFGYEKVDNKSYTKKNLNAMVAFVVAFFVIASSKLVEVITTVSSQVVILLLLSILFLMLVGSFAQQKEEGFFLEGGWKTAFTIIMFIGIVGIFLNALKKDDKSWLEWIMDFMSTKWNTDWVASLILILIVIGMMLWITGSSGPKKEKKE
ncbi:MAG: hypothetical protein PHV16_01945 [Candidatus Nanoarchaeia archaeon]|nr:hypothetical protein [Candidatus Nanoarchaeia archaeon]